MLVRLRRLTERPGSLWQVLFRRLDMRNVAALVSLLVMVACAAVPVDTAPPVTLVLWVDNPAIGASVRQRIVPFEQLHPNIQIKVFDQFGKIRNGDVSTAIEALANTELAPDVVALSDQDFALMSNPNDLMNLSPYIIQDSNFNYSDFFPTVMNVFQYHGRQLGVPSELVPWMIYYNKQIFDRAHVPYPSLDWTDGEFVGDAKRIVQGTSGKQPDTGFVADPTTAILPFIETYGVQPQSAANDPYAKWLQNKKTAEALQWFADLGLRQHIMPIEMANRSLGFWYGGRAAMAGMYMDQRDQLPPYLQRRFSATPTISASPVPQPGWKFKWGVTMVPKASVQSTIYYVSGYGIAQSSRNPDDAWMLIQYLTSHLPEQPAGAYVPARESLAYSKQFADLYPETGRQAYIQSIQEGHRLPAWPPAARPTFADLQGVLIGSVHAVNALQAFRDRIEPILAQPTPVPPTPVGG